MDSLDLHEDLMIIDQLSEGVDWFKMVKESDLIEVAKRIKATSTSYLRKIIDGTICESTDKQQAALSFAKRELAYRVVNEHLDTHIDSNGYDKLNKDIHEDLTSEDPVENWIADFVGSDNPKFGGRSKTERIDLALEAFYAAKNELESIQERRDMFVVKTITNSKHEHILKFFVESNSDIASKTILEIKDSFDEFIFDLVEAAITIGSPGSVKCIKAWGACRVGEVFSGIWKPAGRPNQLRLDLSSTLPGATTHPTIFFDKNTNQLSVHKRFELL